MKRRNFTLYLRRIPLCLQASAYLSVLTVLHEFALAEATELETFTEANLDCWLDRERTLNQLIREMAIIEEQQSE